MIYMSMANVCISLTDVISSFSNALRGKQNSRAPSVVVDRIPKVNPTSLGIQARINHQMRPPQYYKVGLEAWRMPSSLKKSILFRLMLVICPLNASKVVTATASCGREFHRETTLSEKYCLVFPLL